MNHASYAFLRGHGWAGAWMAMVAVAVLAVVAIQTSPLIGTYPQSSERSITPAETSLNHPAVAQYHGIPMVLTVPFAVTRTQQVMVARLKHRAQFTEGFGTLRAHLKAAPGLIAGLAIIQASQSSGR